MTVEVRPGAAAGSFVVRCVRRGRVRYTADAMMKCRPGCGACCIAPSISPSHPALPHGKPAGERCPHLTAAIACALFGSTDRPAVCSSLRPSAEMCGDSAAQAMAGLVRLEALTAPR
jgi:hypothetical protein